MLMCVQVHRQRDKVWMLGCGHERARGMTNTRRYSRYLLYWARVHYSCKWTMRANLHRQLQPLSHVLTTHSAAALLQSDSSSSSSSLLVSWSPCCHLTPRSARPSSFSCRVLTHLRAQLGGSASVCGLSLPFLLLLLSPPFFLPHSLPKAGRSDPCKSLNAESSPLCHTGRLPKYETPNVRSGTIRLLLIHESLDCACLTSVLIPLVVPVSTSRWRHAWQAELPCMRPYCS